MPRNNEPAHVPPMAIAEAMKRLNDASSLMLAKIETVATLLSHEQPTPKQLAAMVEQLTEAADTFRKAVWG